MYAALPSIKWQPKFARNCCRKSNIEHYLTGTVAISWCLLKKHYVTTKIEHCKMSSWNVIATSFTLQFSSSWGTTREKLHSLFTYKLSPLYVFCDNVIFTFSSAPFTFTSLSVSRSTTHWLCTHTDLKDLRHSYNRGYWKDGVLDICLLSSQLMQAWGFKNAGLQMSHVN